MDEKRPERESSPAGEQELREQDVTAADRLDDRVSEAEGLPGDNGDEEATDG